MRQKDTKFFVGVRGRELGMAVGAEEIQLLYRVSPQLSLLQVSGVSPQARRKGQIMGIDTMAQAPEGDISAFCRQVEGVLEQYGFGGLACFFQGAGNPCLEKTVTALEQLCKKRRIPLLLPERYGKKSDYGKVFVSTVLSGGSLEGKFRRAMEQYGRERVVMDIESMAMDFLLPAPQGTGERLQRGQVQALRERTQAQTFFSQELCARYFTYENGEHSLHFVLYDDQKTMEEKIRLSRQWNLWGVAVTYGEYESGSI